MTAIYIVASFVCGFAIGIVKGKYKSRVLAKMAYMRGYKECNSRWKECSTNEIRKKLERRKINHAN